MSKGSQVVTLRMPDDTLAWLDEYLKARLKLKGVEYHNRSSFILDCISFRRAHIERSKKKRNKKATAEV